MLNGRWTAIILCFFGLTEPQSALPVHAYIHTLVADNARRHLAINSHLATWRSVSVAVDSTLSHDILC